ncbi:MAG: hypothetical protein WA989_16875 [Henriciella sp.]|uniref:hypothetical protein n=1 Tax=Henriciella sp. TaxID=1968823 RepID=UPI003C72D255
MASVGAQGPVGEQGEPGEQGTRGPQGAQGETGDPFGLGSAGVIAAGGLVGSEGIAQTGLLANTGDPDTSLPVVSDLLVTTGEGTMTMSAEGMQVASLVDEALPGSTNVTGTVIGTVEAVGMTLVESGNGEQFLLDGLTAAPGSAVSLGVGEATPVGSAESSAMFGGNLLSANSQADGDFDAGVVSDGELVTFEPGSDENALSPINEWAGTSENGLGDAADTLLDVGGKGKGRGLGLVKGAPGKAVGLKGVIVKVTDTTGQLADKKGALLSEDQTGSGSHQGALTGLVGGLLKADD